MFDIRLPDGQPAKLEPCHGCRLWMGTRTNKTFVNLQIHCALCGTSCLRLSVGSPTRPSASVALGGGLVLCALLTVLKLLQLGPCSDRPASLPCCRTDNSMVNYCRYVFSSTFQDGIPNLDSLFGATSLIFWTLTIVVVIK